MINFRKDSYFLADSGKKTLILHCNSLFSCRAKEKDVQIPQNVFLLQSVLLGVQKSEEPISNGLEQCV